MLRASRGEIHCKGLVWPIMVDKYPDQRGSKKMNAYVSAQLQRTFDIFSWAVRCSLFAQLPTRFCFFLYAHAPLAKRKKDSVIVPQSSDEDILHTPALVFIYQATTPSYTLYNGSNTECSYLPLLLPFPFEANWRPIEIPWRNPTVNDNCGHWITLKR